MRRGCFLIMLLAVSWGCSRSAELARLEDGGTDITAGTVGSVCELAGYAGVRVQAYSLVWGLAGTGSSECPSSARHYLIDYIRRMRPQRFMSGEYAQLTAEQLIDSRDTAVVSVQGIVPAGAPKGERFDVEITIPWSTQTTSLQGGWLMRTELQIVMATQATGRMVAGRPTAVATGPVFINPFPLSSDDSKEANPRRGVVLGGGRSSLDRYIQLSILEPSYPLAAQLERRINARFQQTDGRKVADATRDRVSITIPDSYRDRYQHFIRLLLALDLQDSAVYQDTKLRRLDEEVQQEQADYEAIAWAWEAIGRRALDHLKVWYADDSGERAFYAARSAVNIEPTKTGQAIDKLRMMALDDHHPSQVAAAQALGAIADDIRVRGTLSKLLDNPNARLRLLAYRGLRDRDHGRVSSTAISGGFTLDVIDSTGEKLVWVWAAQEPRVIIFGKDLRCRGNVFFETPDGKITINAQPDNDELTIIRKMDQRGAFITIKSPLEVEELIRTLARPVRDKDDKKKSPQPGLTFSQIVGILYRLCEGQENVISARFHLLRRSEDMTD